MRTASLYYCSVQYSILAVTEIPAGSKRIYRNTYRNEINIPDIYRNSNIQGGLFLFLPQGFEVPNNLLE
jgi:hypothetical protein